MIKSDFWLPLCLITASLAGCGEEPEPPIAPRPLLTMTVKPIKMESFGPFASTVEARYESQLGFQASGRMIARAVFVGDLVKKGQRLAAIDPTLAQFALLRASSDVVDAKAQLANAQGIAERQKILLTGGNTPQATMDNATAGLATAKARLDQSEAALRVAKDQVGYTELHANFGGVVTAWSAEVGQYVNSGQSVVSISRPDVLEAVLDIPDDLIADVKTGMSFTVCLQASPKITSQGRVREIGPLADPVTRSHRVRVTLEDPAAAFRIGTTVTAVVQRDIPSRILVPPASIVDDSKGRYVWVLTKDRGHVARRDIVVNGSKDDKAVVESGLAEGDRVVLVGVHSLHDGQAIAAEGGRITKAESTRL